MGKVIDKELLTTIEEDEQNVNSIARLVELGHKQGFVTYDNILTHFPDIEQDLDHLERIFSALLSGGIQYIEDPDLVDITADEIEIEEIETEEERVPKLVSENDHLANIDTNDTIGLYLKEAARVPLLTAIQELELAQRIDAEGIHVKNSPKAG